MSSALVMILTAAMAVPGNGPEMVSAEMEQVLDLRGKWEGEWEDMQCQRFKARIEDGLLDLDYEGGDRRVMHIKITNKGQGRFCITLRGVNFLGVYRQDGNRMIFCLRDPEDRPTYLWNGGAQARFILHRVKPRK